MTPATAAHGPTHAGPASCLIESASVMLRTQRPRPADICARPSGWRVPARRSAGRPCGGPAATAHRTLRGRRARHVPFYPNDQAIADAARDHVRADAELRLGVELGAHVYPLRWKVVTFGFGASYHLSRRRPDADVAGGSSGAAGPTVQHALQRARAAGVVQLRPPHGLELPQRRPRATPRTGRGASDLEEDAGESTRTIELRRGRTLVHQPAGRLLAVTCASTRERAGAGSDDGHRPSAR